MFAKKYEKNDRDGETNINFHKERGEEYEQTTQHEKSGVCHGLLGGRFFVRAAALVGAIFAFGLSRSAAAPGLSVNDINIIGYASYEFGQIVKGQWNGGSVDHYWSHNVYAGIGFDAAMSEKFHLVARVEGKMWNPYPNEDRRDWRQRGYALWLDQARGTYTFNPQFSLTAGYFVYKYNREVRNLGEYMFRSYAYPGVLLNSFDFPASRILGFKFSVNLFDENLKNDIMLFEESEMWPYGDISLAYIGSFSFLNNIFEIGGGVDFSRLISVNDEYTTPRKEINQHIISVDSNGTILKDTSHFYTLKATKLMGRLVLDLKPIIGSPVFFNQEDLKLYGEMGVLGWKNYPFWYEDRSKRMPIMFGMNVPAWKILDVFSIEAEYDSFPFWPDYKKTIDAGAVPLPNNEAATYLPEEYDATHWRWSVYLKKQIIPGFAVTLQLARDHLRLNYSDGQPGYDETLLNPVPWHGFSRSVEAFNHRRDGDSINAVLAAGGFSMRKLIRTFLRRIIFI
ncbi:MAG: hypothetical protein JXA18_00950 [Chitinispirillaceae bacterium]|nr:hypothetical protein [Chitinispirillaceae bacterium]